MSASVTPPPPAALVTQRRPPDVGPSSPYSFSSSSVVTIIIIIASAVVVSASIYLFIRFLSRRFHRSFSAADDVILPHDQGHLHSGIGLNDLLDSLPLFTFRSVTGNLAGGDCAVCLSKFEPHDRLRLLPLCCHAFHADCIDTWIVFNQTCPLCRSTVLPSDSDVLDKILSADNRRTGNGSFRNGSGSGGSFRIEIGSISRRRSGDSEAVEGSRRSYSLGSFEYIVDDNGYEVPVVCTTHGRGVSDCTSNDKVEIPIPELPVEALAGEVSGGRNRLRQYVDRLASFSIPSRAMSFRSSSRFFAGSSRRSESAIVAEDLESNRVGEEIGGLFRWQF